MSEERLLRVSFVFSWEILFLCFFPRFAKKQDLRHLDNVTLPRTGALEIILDELAPSFKERRRREKEEANKSTANGATGNEVKPKEEEDTGNHQDDRQAKEITKIIDVTIAYPEGRPLDLLAIATGYRRPCTTHVHYRVFDINDVRNTRLAP